MSIKYKTYDRKLNNQLINEHFDFGELISDVVKAPLGIVKDVGKEVLQTGTGLAKEAVGVAGGLTKEVAGVAGGVVKDVAGVTGDAVGKAVGGVTGAAGNAVGSFFAPLKWVFLGIALLVILFIIYKVYTVLYGDGPLLSK